MVHDTDEGTSILSSAKLSRGTCCTECLRLGVTHTTRAASHTPAETFIRSADTPLALASISAADHMNMDSRLFWCAAYARRT